MSKMLPISLVAACLVAYAAPQNANDAAGVTVSLNGAEVLHRTGVGYPVDAIRNGIKGTLSVQVKLDSAGEVSDAQVLSGPEELRKPALESVLQWHFAPQLAGATRVIEIAFTPPAAVGTAPAGRMPAAQGVQPGAIRSIRVEGLSEQAGAQLLASLPIHEGDEWTNESAQKARQAAAAFDEHLVIRQQSPAQSPEGAAQVDLVVSTLPGRIKVGGNVQSAMIVSKTPPVYPPAAKAAGIQGSVQLSAVVGTDGAVQEVTVLDGPPELTQSAMDAVKQWVYKPTLLNGNPVQVQTTITINYTLNK